MKNLKTYRELKRFDTFEERFRYLQLIGQVGEDTFGFDRYINQQFYRSVEWKRVRDIVIIRDFGCDLGIKDREIHGRIIIHHMNPIRKEDFNIDPEYLLNPEYLICCTHQTHNAIHYGDEKLLVKEYEPRKPGDTRLWGNV